MKPLFIKKNGTVSKVGGIIMNLIPSYTLAEYNALTHKPLLWVRTDEEYAQIPSEDVSYGDGSVKDALDGLQKTVVTGTLASVTASFVTVSYPLGFSRDNCFVLSFEIFIQGTWRAGEGFYASEFTRSFYVLGSDDIKVYNDNNLLLDCPFRLILAKL